MRLFKRRYEYEKLNQMLDDAIKGEFKEERYDETMLSQLESRWKQYLSQSKMSMKRVETERKNMKSLVSDISHQTKTPLTNIKLYTQLLEEGASDEQKEYVGQIQRQAEKLEFLIQSLVKMSRLESETIQLKPVKQSLQLLIERIYESCTPIANKKEIKIQLEKIEGEAVFDLKWTEEALYNIVDNAIKYSKKKSNITIQIKSYEMYISILVEDSGCGIVEEEREKVFQRFYRGKYVQQKDGIGIGLFLARQIINRQHGYIKALENKPKGTIMAIYLPKENREL